MNLPKYKYLLTYRYSEIVHDLTEEFCRINVSKFSRTFDQMVQASRSGKQNIVEGVGQSDTSKKGEIKLLGVAKASIDELITDFEDFLRQKGFESWDREDNRIREYRSVGVMATKNYPLPKIPLSENSENAANMLLTFCHQLTYLLDKQIASLEKKFIEKGGFTENLFKKRFSHRSPK